MISDLEVGSKRYEMGQGQSCRLKELKTLSNRKEEILIYLDSHPAPYHLVKVIITIKKGLIGMY